VAPTRVPPVKVVRAVERLRHHLLRARQRTAPGSAVLLEMILGGWVSQSIAVVAELKVADALAGGPLTADELARRVGADPDALGRVMRMLASQGVFAVRRGNRYALNAISDGLRSDAAVSLAAMARFVGSPQHREHWSHLGEAVRSGESVIPKLRGKAAFEYLHGEPELGPIFNDAMTSMSELVIDAAVAAYDFGAHPVVVDVGGGHGRLLSAILTATPGIAGVLYDLPPVVDGAPELLRRYGVAERTRIVGGSFFDEVPPGGDLYIAKNVIHDWSDDESVAILRNIRAVAAPGTTLVLLEAVIPDHHREFPPTLIDIEMLVSAGGRERTEAEFGTLYERSGFRLTRVVPTVTPFSLVEGVAV
jgi:hypothetical protein